MTGLTLPAVGLLQTQLEMEQDPAFDEMRKPGISYVSGVGVKDNPLVMFIGEAPGPTENAVGKPFQGKAGKVFQKLLVTYKFDEVPFYVTNVCKYMPVKEDSMNFRRPNDSEIKLSAPYLAKEIRYLNPRWIVLLGNVPLSTVFPGETSVAKYRGKVITGDRLPFEFFVTYHPSSVQYDATKLVAIQRDFKVLSELIRAE